MAASNGVQFAMEKMLPELEDMRVKGYFTEDELRSIVERRRDFEYKVRRRKPDKTSFTRYIEYELALEKLLKKRKKKVGVPMGYVSAADTTVIRRLHSIYSRLLWRYPGDVADWFRYIAFCHAHGSTRALDRMFPRALKAHSRNPDLWIAAARFEYESRNDTVAARAVLQRALRLNAHIPAIWIEYLKLELLYQQKIIDRRRVLGLPVDLTEQDLAAHATQDDLVLPTLAKFVPKRHKGIDDAAEVETARSGALFDLSDSDDESGDSDEGEFSDPFASSDDDDQAEEEDLKPDDDDEDVTNVNLSLLASAVPRSIFRGARKAFPSDLSLRTAAIDLYLRFDNTQLALEDVYESLTEDFGDPEGAGYGEAMDLLAKRPMLAYLASHARYTRSAFHTDAFMAAWAAMEERYAQFLDVGATPSFVEAYLSTLLELVDYVASHEASVAGVSVVVRTLELAQQAAESGLLTRKAAGAWIAFRGRVPDVLVAADTLSLEAVTAAVRILFPSDAGFALQWVTAMTRVGRSPKHIVSETLPLLESHSLEGPDLGMLWKSVLTLALYGNKGHPAVSDGQRDALISAALGGGMGAHTDLVVFDWALSSAPSIKKARATYTSMLASTILPSRPLLMAAVRFEMALPKLDMEAILPLHDTLTSTYGSKKDVSSVPLWLDYIRTLVRGQASGIKLASTYKTAIRALPNNELVEVFISGYRDIVA